MVAAGSAVNSSHEDLAVTRAGCSRLAGSSPAWLMLIGILAGYFTLLLSIGGHHEWDELGVPPLSPAFYDLRSVTSGWECARAHLGAWPDNPCDPAGRPENYPRIWMAAAILGLGEGDTYLIGSVIVVLFFAAAILVVPRRAPLGEALVYGVALCSPAVMFGVERGNVDIGLFTMVAAAGLVMRRTPHGPPVASALILVAAVLKLFPIAAIGMLAQLPRRTAAILLSSVGGLFTLYAVATFRDIQTIERVLPQGDEYAYGLHIFAAWLGRIGGSSRAWEVAVIVLTLAAAIALRRTAHDAVDTDPSRNLDLFWGGAGIYVVTFALVRNSDYRLVFLLLTIPQLVRWASTRRALPNATLVAVLLTLWLPSPWRNIPVLDDAIRRWNNLTLVGGEQLPIEAPAQVAVFMGLTCLLATTFPSRNLGMQREAIWRRKTDPATAPRQRAPQERQPASRPQRSSSI